MKVIFINRPLWFYPMKERIGLINEIIEKTVEYEYWSVYFLYNKIDPYSAIYLKEEKEKKYIFKNLNDLLKKINELERNSIIFSGIDFDYIGISIYKKILEKNIKLNLFYSENTPGLPSVSQSQRKKCFKILFKLMDTKLFFENLNKIYRKLNFQSLKKSFVFQIKKQKLKINILYSGRKCREKIEENFSEVKEKFNFISIMSRDLRDYLQIKTETRNQVVFLDQNLGFHPDFKLTREKIANFNEYYFKLNLFFNYIEKKFNTEVVIAAHPSSNYSKNIFENRKIIKGKTMEEIKKSRFILGHCSTSLGVITIEKKILLLLSINNFFDTILEYIELFSKELNCQVIDLNEDYQNKSLILKVDEKKYEEYYKNYLYDGKDYKPTVDIILEIIQESVN